MTTRATGVMRLQIDDLVRPPARPVAWLTRHPIMVDAAVVLVACGPPLAALIFRAYDFGWWGYPLLAVAAVALFLRRRHPFVMLIIVAFACAFSPLAQPGLGFPLIPFAFALYTVASRQPTWRAIAGYGIGIGLMVLATIPFSLNGIQPPRVVLIDQFSLIAVVIGVIVKSRRDRKERLLELVNERIEHAALTERSRIAAEMHDVVAHSLTVIVSLANGAASIRARNPAKADAAVAQISTVSREALDEMHRVLGLLRSADAGLDENLHHSGDNLPTLDELAERFRSAGLPVTLAREGEPLPEDTAVRHAVFRIVQESLTNTLRHSLAPSSASVQIVHRDARIEIRVDDDGASATPPSHTGYGLVGIEQRARAFSGSSEGGPRPGGGWRTRAVLHLDERRETG